MVISPTPGRIVWYYETAIQHDLKQPLAAMVAYVWNDRLVNLDVTQQDGTKVQRTSVTLVQDDPTPVDRYAVWPQNEQAKKAT